MSVKREKGHGSEGKVETLRIMQVHFILPSAPMEDLMKLKWSRIRWKIRRKYLVRDSILVLGFTKRVNYRKAEKKMRSAPNKSQYRTLKNKSRPTLLQSAVLRRTPNIHRTFQLHYKFFVVEKLIQIIHWKFSRGIIVKTPFWALTLFTCTIPLFQTLKLYSYSWNIFIGTLNPMETL